LKIPLTPPWSGGFLSAEGKRSRRNRAGSLSEILPQCPQFQFPCKSACREWQRPYHLFCHSLLPGKYLSVRQALRIRQNCEVRVLRQIFQTTHCLSDRIFLQTVPTLI